MAIDIGRIAYAAYYQTLKDNNPNQQLPAWEDLGSEQIAWRHSAIAVLQHMRETQQYERDHPDAVD